MHNCTPFHVDTRLQLLTSFVMIPSLKLVVSVIVLLCDCDCNYVCISSYLPFCTCMHISKCYGPPPQVTHARHLFLARCDLQLFSERHVFIQNST
jgi:hypothetical protein